MPGSFDFLVFDIPLAQTNCIDQHLRIADTLQNYVLQDIEVEE